MHPLNRRDFMRHASLFTAGGLLLKAADAKTVIAETKFGKIRGADIDGIKVFKGVPYGASTAGKNRFMPPADPAPWSGVREALEYGHSAPQAPPGGGLTMSGNRMPDQGEDCLVLNVWTP